MAKPVKQQEDAGVQDAPASSPAPAPVNPEQARRNPRKVV